MGHKSNDKWDICHHVLYCSVSLWLDLAVALPNLHFSTQERDYSHELVAVLCEVQ